MERKVLLGFPEQAEKEEHLQRHKFPSKLGGLPAWLNPEALPCEHQLFNTCFLLQVYAPHPTSHSAFHRQLLLLPHCHANPPACTVLRTQLPRSNRLYPFHPPQDGDSPPPLPDGSFPSRTFWEERLQQSGPVFPEYKLVVEDEDEEDIAHDTNSTNFAINANTGAENADHDDSDSNPVLDQPSDSKNGATGKMLEHSSDSTDGAVDGGDEESAEDRKLLEMFEQEATPTERQSAFTAFTQRVEQNPGHVLRYSCHADAEPLWPIEGKPPSAEDVPHCELCGSRRVFELQVLPHAVHFLEQDESPDGSERDLVDFGTIAVYSCEASCSPFGDYESAYVHEHAVVLPPLDSYGDNE